ncbi:MAG: Na+/H+ antiporter NhaA [Kangiellaceae bacterium]|jgi:NhaA family Na+:H+ antiporter|nr:Na+/H+ antiporter NhaA [Kangiellaceae bacterium]
MNCKVFDSLYDYSRIQWHVNAFFIPIKAGDDIHIDSPLEHLLHNLHPYVSFGVLPLFAFANAGIDLSNVSFNNIFQDVPLGILLGLFVGKQLGVFIFSALAIKSGLCKLPENATWKQLYGTAILCGIGFTMSLFIASLAFAHGGAGENGIDRLAILLASVASAVLGYLVLRFASPATGQ